MTRVPHDPARKIADAASGKARTDTRQSSMVSSDDVRSVSDGVQRPIEALEEGTPEIEIGDVLDTAREGFPLDRFMEEKVTIIVPASNVEGDLAFVEPRVNGVSAIIPRGKKVIVKRKFVEALANAKQSTYSQSVVNVDQANIETPLTEQVALAFGFTVLDDTPRGVRWIEGLLRRAA